MGGFHRYLLVPLAAIALALPGAAKGQAATGQVIGVVEATVGVTIDESGGFAGPANSVDATVSRERVGDLEIVTVVPQ